MESETSLNRLLSPACFQALQEVVASTARPDTVWPWLEEFLHISVPEGEAAPARWLPELLADAQWGPRLVRGLGHSGFVARVARRWPDFLFDLYRHGIQRPAQWYQPALDQGLAAVGDSSEGAQRVLRHIKQREYLRLCLLDFNGEMPVMQVTEALTALAEATLEGALSQCRRRLVARHGTPMLEAEASPPRPCAFVVLGMGKLGGRELNFSSDVDLIFLHEGDSGSTDGSRSISLKQFHVQLGRDLIQMIQTPTGDGFVFRVDMRLRPEGESGELSLSLGSAELYYEAFGRTWERAAMIKARPVAGDRELGERFLQRIRPFIYRRYLDFAALDAIHDMKRRIDDKVTRAEDYDRNVKLGRGGIREIEFIVQSMQLVHGGRREGLRCRPTLEALDHLVELGMVEASVRDRLRQAYLFLRTLEHRLQMAEEHQTHSLPAEAEERERVARRMGRGDWSTLEAEFRSQTDAVHLPYRNLFAQRRHAAESQHPLVRRLLAHAPHHPEVLEALGELGLAQHDAAVELLRLLREGPALPGLPEGALQWYHKLAPGLLEEWISAPDPALAGAGCVSFLNRVGSRTHYLALLVENPPVLGLLMRLFGSSPYLSHFLNNHPELLDDLITHDLRVPFRDRGALGRELAQRMEQCPDEECRIFVLSDFKNREMLRLGVRDLAGLAEPQEVMAGLSALADVMLTQVMATALGDMEERHGSPRWTDASGQRHQAGFAIVAMGKLGGGEINYASDLDLLFVHGSAGDDQVTDGAHPLPNAQFFGRLGQRIVSRLSTFTKAGRLYELDMRLRPSGNSGPLVTSFEAFCHYQRHEAWTWEHQALTRARVVVGDADLSRRIREEIHAVLTRPRDRVALQNEVRDMRLRMFREKQPAPGTLDIKQGRGGIVDVEFLSQYLILAHAGDHPRLLQRHTGVALLTAADLGLLPRDEAEDLEEAYGFYRLVENRLRLIHGSPVNRIDDNPILLRQLARLCALPAHLGIHQALGERMERVYPVYCRLLGETPAAWAEEA
ncbi:MAG: bifunctional [glutamate--ammonia ligase]-adenylyl-L-tyrosine phosphorylase/[glutamate--ammonia-ligase] adenylyltransferase [Magnetococcus sp. WYHC-3]